ncbi:MAG: type II secretion system protein N [Oxalobacteraceae bacterium]
MKRLSAAASLLLFLALCASLAYWLLQWFAPAPRTVVAPPVAQGSMPPLSAADTLFGGNPQRTLTVVQLRGILHADRDTESVAILAIEGKPPRAVHISAEVTPGLVLKAIQARAVIVSERGMEREVILPDVAALAVTAPSGSEGNASTSVSAQRPASSPTPQVATEPPQVVQGSDQGATTARSATDLR